MAGYVGGVPPARSLERIADNTLSLRDQMAMAALNGLISGNAPYQDHQSAAVDAYLYADAMLEARLRRGAFP